MRGNRLCQVQICKKLTFRSSTGYDEEFHPVFLAPVIFYLIHIIPNTYNNIYTYNIIISIHIII